MHKHEQGKNTTAVSTTENSSQKPQDFLGLVGFLILQ
jgi:hypothetical protein